MAQLTQHVPVLLDAVLDGLKAKPGGRFIDCTLGGGGHTTALLERSAPDGRVLAMDADPSAVERVRSRLLVYGDRAVVAHTNFAALSEVARSHGFEDVDGILMDLGLSSDQLASDRGFAIRSGGALDMRFDPTRGETAADLVNSLDVDELADLIFKYGEEPASRRIARAIVAARPIRSAEHLAQLIAEAVRRRGRLHPATLTFQALRIAVNDELGSLTTALPQAISLLRPGGRLAVISFHSLEDRIVKEFFRRESRAMAPRPDAPSPGEDLRPGSGARQPTLRLTFPKPIVPADDEVALNPRARSARLRIAEKR